MNLPAWTNPLEITCTRTKKTTLRPGSLDQLNRIIMFKTGKQSQKLKLFQYRHRSFL